MYLATDLTVIGYTVNCLRYMIGAEPLSVTSASPLELAPSKDASPPNVDTGMTASFSFPGDATAAITCSLGEPLMLGFIPRIPTVLLKVTCENGEMKVYNFVLPTFYHYIEVTTKTGPQGKHSKKRTEKVYKPSQTDQKGEDWWTTSVVYLSPNYPLHLTYLA